MSTFQKYRAAHGEFGGQHATRPPERSSYRRVTDDELAAAHLERCRAAMDEQDSAPAPRWMVWMFFAVVVAAIVLWFVFASMVKG